MNQLCSNSICCDNPTLRNSTISLTNSITPAIWSSVVMAGAGMGDALLYAWLPVEGQTLGMSALAIGILLSVNKFIRFFTNRWIAYAAKDWGIRVTLFLGVLLAGFTNFIYALDPALWIWVIARLLWGLSFSALRFSTLQYAGGSGRTARALGIGRSIQEAGPLLAYWIGPLLLNIFGGGVVFSGLGLITFLLIPTFYFLPDLKSGNQDIKAFRLSFPGTTDAWVFLSSFAAEGLLIVGISKIVYLEGAGHSELLIASALYISTRRVMNLIISPAAGWLSDKWGFKRVFNASCLLILIGLILIATGSSNVGVLITFFGSGINMTLVPVLAMDLSAKNRNFDSLTKLSTSRDIGSAAGSLVGLYLLSSLSISLVFGLLCLVLTTVWFCLRKFDKVYE